MTCQAAGSRKTFNEAFKRSFILKLLLHTGLRLKIGVLIDGIVDQQLIRGFEKPFDMQDFVRVSFLPMRLFELNFRKIKLLFACFFNLSFKMCCTKKIY